MSAAGRWGMGAGAASAAVAGAGLAGLAGFTAWTARRVERVLPPQGRMVAVEGNRLHVLDVGSGPTLLLIHGLGGQMRNFTYGVVDRLTDRFRVVVVERPGAGYSTRAPGASARLGVQAQVMAALCRRMGIERPLVVGHSLGGALALALALEHPGLARGLALVSPLTAPQESVPPAFAGLAIPSPVLRRAIGWTIATPLALRGRERVLAALFGPEETPDDFAIRGGGALGLRPQAFVSASTDLVAVNEDLPGYHARYGELDLPVGLLFGAGDRILDPAVHGAPMAGRVEGLAYETLAGGGHMIPITRSAEVADFIARVDARTERAA